MTERAFELAGEGVQLVIIAVAVVVTALFMVLGWFAVQLGLVK